MDLKDKGVEIRPARKEDIAGILALQKNLLLSENSDKDIEGKGFLVYAVTIKELTNIINDDSGILLVAYGAEGVVGYALAYSLSRWIEIKPTWNSEIDVTDSDRKRLSTWNILYFRHIARKEGYKSIGKQLEEATYKIARSRGCKLVIGEILEKPYLNRASKTIHEQRGFRRIGSVSYGDGKLWGIYEKIL